jgi:low molecular weight phosphotyrosine protein phosphatase
MAEAVFRDITKYPSNPLLADVDSAGTGAYHTGSAPDSRTLRTLKANGVTTYKHSARKVHDQDFETFDWIFAMDSDNLDDLETMKGRARRKKGKAGEREGLAEAGQIMLFGDFGGKKGEEVVDPYYGADNGFDIAYEQMVRFTNGFLKHLEKERAGKE